MSDVNFPMQLEAATKRYKKKVVLDGLALSIPAGSVVGLLGKNGAGKTTLIKAALGLIKLNGGSARIFGEDAWTLSAAAKARVGYVPQVVTLYPWMRVRQICDYVGAFYPRWNSALVDRLVREWELDREAKVGTL